MKTMQSIVLFVIMAHGADASDSKKLEASCNSIQNAEKVPPQENSCQTSMADNNEVSQHCLKKFAIYECQPLPAIVMRPTHYKPPKRVFPEDDLESEDTIKYRNQFLRDLFARVSTRFLK